MKFSPILQTASLRTTLKALALSTLAATALTPSVTAQQLMVGGPDSFIRQTIPVVEDFDVVGACGGIVESMASVGETTFIGDSSGVIYVHEPGVGVNYAFNAGNDAAALAANSTYLYVGGSDGTIERYALASYSLVDVWIAPAGLRALAISSISVYAAGDNGEIHSAIVIGTTAGQFSFYVDAGMPIAALTSTASRLLSASDNGVVKSISFGSLVLSDIRQTAAAQFGPQFQITVGSTWSFQAWFRDPTGPCGNPSNSTNSARVNFTL